MIADLYVYELGDVMLLTMSGRREGRRAGEARSVHLLARTCSSATSPLHVCADRRRRSGRRGGGAGDRSAASVGRRCARCAEHGNAARQVARGGTGDRHAYRGRRASRASTCSSSAARASALQAALRAVGRGRGSTRRPPKRLRIEAGVPLFRPRHGRGDDPARGRHRVAARSASPRAATSGRKSSSACCTAATAASRESSVGLTLDGDAGSGAGHSGRGRGDREIGRVTSSAHVAGAASARSRSATCTATFVEPGTAGVGRRPRRRPSRRCRSSESISISSASAGGNASAAELRRRVTHRISCPELRRAAPRAARTGRNAARPTRSG